MAEFQYKSGLGKVGSYQISGIPWATSSVEAPVDSSAPLEIVFPSITKFFIIKNISSANVQLRVGFSENGVKNTGNYFILNKNESFEGDLRVSKLFLLSNDASSTVPVTVVAGLTGILSNNLPNNWSGSAGVG